MPILHSAYKAIKVNKKKELRNQAVTSKIKTETKKFLTLLSENKLDEAKKQLQLTVKILDKATSKGIIHKNTASRKKSRLSKKLSKQK